MMRTMSLLVCLLLVVSGVANASAGELSTGFNCGKQFITFPGMGGSLEPGNIVSVRKHEVLRVFLGPGNDFPGWVVLKNLPSSDDAQGIHVVGIAKDKWQMIVTCLN